MLIVETQVKQGIVRGLDKGDYTLFAGIPYASPPIGKLRFCAPEEPDAWDRIYYADHFEKICRQDSDSMGSFFEREFHSTPGFRTEMSEDCLYLNIWTPAQSVEEKLPVAFWIHGGAFWHGYGHEIEFDGKEYCKRGVILVTFNYRLGVFGFLAHPWLTEENKYRISGNYGCLDQIAALKWVRDNIAAFGGDPENITVFGQSAGAKSAQTLISSPLTENWIAKAIFQSAGGYATGFHQNLTLGKGEEIGIEFTEYAKIYSLEELRSVDEETLCNLAVKYRRDCTKNQSKFLPNIDGYLLLDEYDASMDRGLVKDIPYMLGSTLNDFDMGLVNSDGRSALYHGCIKWSQKLQEQGRKPAYVYDFRRQLPGDDAGAFHSAELWYMFGTLDRCWRPMTEADYTLSEIMIDYWTDFMKTGNTGGDWRLCTKDDVYIKRFDV